MKKIAFYISVAFFVSMFFYIMIENFKRPRIYVVSSYNTDFKWVVDIEKGINEVFDKYPKYLIKKFYLDTKNHPSLEHLQMASHTAIKLIEKWNPDILILIDDNAQKIIGKHFINHKKTKIIFSGVDAPYKKYYDGAYNVTGLKQELPLTSFKMACSLITPARGKKMVVIGDTSETMTEQIEMIKKFDFAPFQIVDIIQCKTFNDWKNAINNSSLMADYIVMSVFHTIKSNDSNQIIPGKEVLKWTDENAKIPFLNVCIEGGIISVGNSTREQGAVPAKMAVDLLEGKYKNIKDIPVEYSQYSMVYLRPELMKKFNINIPSIYYSFAYATNTIEEK